MKTAVEDIKERIKQTPISSIIGNYMSINKRGANFEGICPFHSDTKPSLKINDQKGIYKCFACGASGDAIKFAQDFKDLEFIDALKDIGGLLGLSVDDLSLKKKVDPKQEFAIRVINAANRLYLKYTKEKKPKEFTDFLKKRELSAETAEQFQISFAPKLNLVWDYLNQLPEDQKTPAIEAAMEIGIIREGKWGPYDFFRERIIFPIWDHYGQVRGFSSRAVREDQIPKYLNSGESFVFDKSNILFSFNFARSQVRSLKKVLIVEGHMDAISMHQAGFDYSVATMGTALSVNNIRLLAGQASEIILGMDTDDAGWQASRRINQDLLKAGVFAKYLTYAPEKDPDDFLKKYSRLELTKRIEEAPLLIDVVIEKIIPQEIPSSTEKKFSLLEEVFKELTPLGNHLMAQEKVIIASKRLGMSTTAEAITQAYQNFLKSPEGRTKEYAPAATPNNTPEDQGPVRAKRPSQPTPKVIDRAEASLVKTLVSHPELLSYASESQVLDLVTHSKVKHFISWLFELYFEIDETQYMSFMRTEFSKESADLEIKDIVMSALFDFQSVTLNKKVAEQMIKDITARLKIAKLKDQRKELMRQHRLAQSEDETIRLLQEIGELNTVLGNLKRF